MNLQEFLEGFKNFDYNNPDFENMGSWPAGVQLLTCLLVAGLIVAGGYWFLIKPDYKILEREARKEGTVKQEFSNKAFQVANLPAYKLQLEEMRETFGALLEQLPDETEISGLLDDITFTGVQSGLEFDNLKLQQDVPSEFYIETPISVLVRGEYHELGTFVSGISALPRIVTLHDYTIVDVSSRDVKTKANICKSDQQKNRNQSSNDANDALNQVVARRAPLCMLITAKTYRYNPGGEVE